MDERVSTRLARDRLAMLAEMYNIPSRVPTIPTSKQLRERKPSKQNDLNEFPFPLQPSPPLLASRGYSVAQTTPKRSRLRMPMHAYQEQKECKIHTMCFREDSCAILHNSISTPDPDLWVLPDFEDWELETESPSTTSQRESWNDKKSTERAPLVQRAVQSNQERLRRRLEGDGWDFVGGRHGEDMCTLKETRKEEDVDEEFDVVVLPPLVRAV